MTPAPPQKNHVKGTGLGARVHEHKGNEQNGANRQSVEHPFHYDGGQYAAGRGLDNLGRGIGPHEFAEPGGKHVVGHEAYKVGREQAAHRVIPHRGQEHPPAEAAQPEAEAQKHQGEQSVQGVYAPGQFPQAGEIHVF